MSRELKLPLFGYGGNFTSAYHWKDGVGPRDQRVSMLNTAWGIPEYNQFGTDEFLRFCQLIGAEPQIALNLGTGTPQEAADWVQYVNAHWADHSGGLLWELGNELWGDFQVGYPTLPRVAEKTKSFSDAVRKTGSEGSPQPASRVAQSKLPASLLVLTRNNPSGHHFLALVTHQGLARGHGAHRLRKPHPQPWAPAQRTTVRVAGWSALL